jgi:circadian clock protein KaiB
MHLSDKNETAEDTTTPEDHWKLRLYIAGDSPKSRVALANLRRLCDEHLKGQFEIEVIDLMREPMLAKTHQIVAIPTLIRKVPEPIKRVIGDLSDSDKALVALDLTGGR